MRDTMRKARWPGASENNTPTTTRPQGTTSRSHAAQDADFTNLVHVVDSTPFTVTSHGSRDPNPSPIPAARLAYANRPRSQSFSGPIAQASQHRAVHRAFGAPPTGVLRTKTTVDAADEAIITEGEAVILLWKEVKKWHANKQAESHEIAAFERETGQKVDSFKGTDAEAVAILARALRRKYKERQEKKRSELCKQGQGAAGEKSDRDVLLSAYQNILKMVRQKAQKEVEKQRRQQKLDREEQEEREFQRLKLHVEEQAKKHLRPGPTIWQQEARAQQYLTRIEKTLERQDSELQQNDEKRPDHQRRLEAAAKWKEREQDCSDYQKFLDAEIEESRKRNLEYQQAIAGIGGDELRFADDEESRFMPSAAPSPLNFGETEFRFRSTISEGNGIKTPGSRPDMASGHLDMPAMPPLQEGKRTGAPKPSVKMTDKPNEFSVQSSKSQNKKPARPEQRVETTDGPPDVPAVLIPGAQRRNLSGSPPGIPKQLRVPKGTSSSNDQPGSPRLSVSSCEPRSSSEHPSDSDGAEKVVSSKSPWKHRYKTSFGTFHRPSTGSSSRPQLDDTGRSKTAPKVPGFADQVGDFTHKFTAKFGHKGGKPSESKKPVDDRHEALKRMISKPLEAGQWRWDTDGIDSHPGSGTIPPPPAPTRPGSHQRTVSDSQPQPPARRPRSPVLTGVLEEESRMKHTTTSTHFSAFVRGPNSASPKRAPADAPPVPSLPSLPKPPAPPVPAQSAPGTKAHSKSKSQTITSASVPKPAPIAEERQRHKPAHIEIPKPNKSNLTAVGGQFGQTTHKWTERAEEGFHTLRNHTTHMQRKLRHKPSDESSFFGCVGVEDSVMTGYANRQQAPGTPIAYVNAPVTPAPPPPVPPIPKVRSENELSKMRELRENRIDSRLYKQMQADSKAPVRKTFDKNHASQAYTSVYSRAQNSPPPETPVSPLVLDGKLAADDGEVSPLDLHAVSEQLPTDYTPPRQGWRSRPGLERAEGSRKEKKMYQFESESDSDGDDVERETVFLDAPYI